MHKIIISLTTISSRLNAVHLVLKSLLRQNFQSDNLEVRLYLSKDSYLLDEGCPTLTPEIESLLSSYPGKLLIKYVENTGPYRKILPVINELYQGTIDDFHRTLIVTADDDTAYPENWLRNLYDGYMQNQCVIGFRGRAMCFHKGSTVSYRKWTKNVTENPSPSIVPTGKDGVLYSPSHFHPAVKNVDAARYYAPKADDLWLKAHTLMMGVPSFLINTSLEDEFPSVPGNEESISLYRSFNQRGGNDEAVANIDEYLRSKELSFAKLCSDKDVLKRRCSQEIYNSIVGLL